MRVGTDTLTMLAMTGGIGSGIVGYNIAKPKVEGLEDWQAGTLALGSLAVGMAGANGVYGALSGTRVAAPKAAGILGASLGVGALLGTAIAAAGRLDDLQ